MNKPKNRALCLRCHMLATWDVNGRPYCETCGPERAQELLATEGVASRFHCRAGFTWDIDDSCCFLIPITMSTQ